MSSTAVLEEQKSNKPIESLDEVVIRFAGDSGDGMQLAGTQFTRATVIFGNDVSTFPDYPAEIRAPAGSLAGVSGFQVNFSSHDIHTPGDMVDTLVAFNPAALKTNIKDVKSGGIVIANEDAFGKTDLKKAGYETNPLEDGTLSKYRVFKIPISKLNSTALANSGLGAKEVDRCKNFFALGLISWLYHRPLEPTVEWIERSMAKKPEMIEANKAVLKAGYYFGETCELFQVSYKVSKAKLAPGKYRRISGNEATALGLIAAANLASKELFYASYPITPASDVLHSLAKYKNYHVKTFQAEDEIAAMTAAIGASFAGDIAVTGTSGPGLALKGEGIGLAVMTELPVVIVDVQRGGPSTGLPTKTEQADLFQAVLGRNGECPVCVLAACGPADCFDMAIEAVRIATRYMTPVILLTDGYIANGEEPWLLPSIKSLPRIEIHHPEANGDAGAFKPYKRDDKLARPWAIPGTKGLEHRIGGLEKQDVTGNVSYDPDNHEHMIHTRARKIAGIANDLPDQTVYGPAEGDLLVVGWGGTAGAIRSAVERAQQKGHKVAGTHLRYMNPFPKNFGDLLKRYKKVLVCELNMGQLRYMLRATYLVDALGLNKVQGKPFRIAEIESKILDVLGSK
ncbi:MAG: 2-oxoglutarate ferredoxin oxidoreductase subunit alpha [Phycisphaerae bacterium]|nr:MAG: 2-oxoglutarate ferredoxin oxidoreductase subunit alpha [Planctomycetota bacterium]GJQ27589.1 MAG: 2-oxoglutarate ferredoxin oxidoreductase subunit alpha [Phycisphaerae bacterium]